MNNILRQQYEDEVERYDELEKQHDKRLNMILFALSVLGLTEIIYSVTGAKEMSLWQHSLALGIPLMLGIVFWQIIIKGRR